jgi:hypothetical protein
MWLFWLAGAAVITVGLVRGGERQPRFLVTTGLAIEIWRGAERESTVLRAQDGATIFEAAPSPDGTRIAYVQLTQSAGPVGAGVGVDMLLVARDGSNSRVLIRHGAPGEFIESLAWINDGEIAYAISTPQGEEAIDQRIETVDVVAGIRRRLVSRADQVAFLDGGKLIVNLAGFQTEFTAERPVMYDLTTGEVAPLSGYSLPLVYVGSYAPSPDRRSIAFGAADPTIMAPRGGAPRATSANSARHPVLQDVWLMATDGSNLRRIADLAVNQPSLAWSNNGRHVYVLSAVGFWRVHAASGSYEKIGPGQARGRIKLLPGR